MEYLLNAALDRSLCLFLPPIASLNYIEHMDAIALADQGGFLPEHDEWIKIREYIDSFYRQITPEALAAHNFSCEPEQRRRETPTVPPSRRRVSGFVYMITNGSLVKVGMSQQPLTRLRDLQHASTIPLTLLHCVRSLDVREVEAFLHVRFDEHRVQGEWFNLTTDHVEWFKSQTPESLLELVEKGVPHERITSWQGLAKQLRRDFETGGGVLGRHSQ